jgi:hypothetical protein
MGKPRAGVKKMSLARERENLWKWVKDCSPPLTLMVLIASACCILYLNIPTVNATLTVIQPSNADTSIMEDNPDGNSGDWPFVAVSPHGPNNKVRVLIKFDLSSIPVGSTVNEAHLQLYYYSFGTDGNNPADRTLNVYRVTEDWDEMEATWNVRKAGIPWTTPGGYYDDTVFSSSIVPGEPGQWMIWDVKSIVKAWIEGGQPNYGFIIRDLEEDENPLDTAISFYSKEYLLDPDLQPTLEVEWLPPTTTTMTVPALRPSSNPVGGSLMSANKLSILSPYLALIGLSTVVAVAVIKRKR